MWPNSDPLFTALDSCTRCGRDMASNPDAVDETRYQELKRNGGLPMAARGSGKGAGKSKGKGGKGKGKSDNKGKGKGGKGKGTWASLVSPSWSKASDEAAKRAKEAEDDNKKIQK